MNGQDPLLSREPDISDLIGLHVVKAEMVTGKSNADERVVLTFNNDWQLVIGTSEWLHVEIKVGVTKLTTASAS